ncbi:hypothetical protein [Fusobacterium sp. 1001295B_180824_G3]|nr:hypothetical protein [Fusobacterium sp. 1001295B_180824_G3]
MRKLIFVFIISFLGLMVYGEEKVTETNKIKLNNNKKIKNMSKE